MKSDAAGERGRSSCYRRMCASPHKQAHECIEPRHEFTDGCMSHGMSSWMHESRHEFIEA